MKSYALLASFMMLALSPAHAQEQQAAARILQPGQTLITLSANETMTLQQDQLQASLRVEVDSKDAKEVQDKINKTMQQALALARSYAEVKTSTGQYFVYQFDPMPQPAPAGKDIKSRMHWKGSQTIDLKAKNSQQLLELSGKLQDLGFMMSGLNYTLSTEQEEANKDTLMTAALAKIQKRAAVAAKALGKSGYDLVEISVDNQGQMHPMPMMMMAKAAGMESDAVATPAAQSGEQEVNMTVTAQVILKP